MDKIKKLWNLCEQYSILLILGSILAIVLANTLPGFYNGLTHFVLFENGFIGHYHEGHYEITLTFLVNEILMTLYFTTVGKEIWEAVALKNGALRGKQSLSVILTTLGGIFGPIVIFLIISTTTGNFKELSNGWAIPTATDIAFASTLALFIFGRKHIAISFLLALAVLDDLFGIIILALFYPNDNLQPILLLISICTAIISYILFNYLPRKSGNLKLKKYIRKIGTFPFFIACAISWVGFYKAGIHPVLSSIPILMTMPHSETDEGIFAEVEEKKRDLLNEFEHKLKITIPVILGLFGFVNAGVVFSTINDATWAVFLALVIGKPLGITIFGLLAMKFFGLPKGMQTKDLPILGTIAGIGFTVSLFVSLQAFPAGEIQDGAKMGALFSFFAAIIAVILAKILKIKKEVGKKRLFAVVSQTVFYFLK